MNKTFTPFNDKEKQFDNAVNEVTTNLDMVINHYGLFLHEGDFEYGRERQFHKPNMDEAITYQREITRLSWLLSKCFEYGSSDSVRLWNIHRNNFEYLKELMK